MIETKEVYDAMEDLALTWTKHGDVAMGQALHDAHETIEALRDVARAGQGLLSDGGEPNPVNVTWLEQSLEALPDWLTDE